MILSLVKFGVLRNPAIYVFFNFKPGYGLISVCINNEFRIIPIIISERRPIKGA